MVLTRDENPSCIEILDRVIGTVVAELHLRCPRAAGQGQQLVAEADAEYRHAGRKQFTQRNDGVGTRLRIAGSVRQEYTIRFARQHFTGGSGGGYDFHIASAVGE